MLVATFLVATINSLVWSQEPIRKRIEWADIWVTDTDKSDLPRVPLIGDSITRGYFDGVERQLAGKAYCARLTTSKCVADPSFLDEVPLLHHLLQLAQQLDHVRAHGQDHFPNQAAAARARGGD